MSGGIGSQEAKAARLWLGRGCPLEDFSGNGSVTSVRAFDTTIKEDDRSRESKEVQNVNNDAKPSARRGSARGTNAVSAQGERKDSRGGRREDRTLTRKRIVSDFPQVPDFGPAVLPTNLRLKLSGKPLEKLPDGWSKSSLISKHTPKGFHAEAWISPEGLFCDTWPMAAMAMALKKDAKNQVEQSSHAGPQASKLSKIRNAVGWVRGFGRGAVALLPSQVAVMEVDKDLRTHAEAVARLMCIQRMRASLVSRDRFMVRRRKSTKKVKKEKRASMKDEKGDRRSIGKEKTTKAPSMEKNPRNSGSGNTKKGSRKRKAST